MIGLVKMFEFDLVEMWEVKVIKIIIVEFKFMDIVLVGFCSGCSEMNLLDLIFFFVCKVWFRLWC